MAVFGEVPGADYGAIFGAGRACRCVEALSGAWRLAPGEGNKVLLGGFCVYFSIWTLLHLENVAKIAFNDFL